MMLSSLQFDIWYHDPVQFYKDIFKEDPYPYQAKVLEDIKQYPKIKRILICAAGGTGKTKLLAALALYLVCVVSKHLGEPVTLVIISGSKDQARNLYEYCRQAFKDSEVLRNEVEGEALMSITRLKNRSVIRAVPNSLKAIQGLHTDVVIIDEAVLAGNFIIRDAFRIVAQSDKDLIILSGTPMNQEGGELFIELFEEEARYPEWKRYHWSAKDCPKISLDQYIEAQKNLPEDMFSIFWEGEPYQTSNSLIPLDKLKKACKDVPILYKDPNGGRIVGGIDWGFCISADTEVLTEDGWKRLDTIKKGEKILCLDPNTLTSLFLEVNNIIVKQYKGLMTHIKSRNLDILVKPSHPLLYLDRYKKKLHLHYAYEHVTHHYLIRKAVFDGDLPTTFTLPAIESKRTDLDFTSKELPIIPFLKFLGWYISEGYCYKKKVVITQSSKSKYLGEIERTLRDLGFHYLKYSYRNETKFIIYSVQLVRYLQKLGKAKNKYIPKEIKRLHGSLLKYLLETLLKGDGDKFFPRYNTYSKQLAEDVLEIACKTGEYHGYIVDRGRKGYRVNLLKKDSSPNAKHYKDIYYEGNIVALEVPTEIFFAKRNGKVCFLHNKDPTAVVIVQLPREENQTINILYVDQWRREQFSDIHDRIVELTKRFGVEEWFTDAEDVGENQRLVEKGLNVTPIAFNKYKVEMQTNLKLLFHQEKIKIPNEYYDLISQLRKYNWDTKKGEDLVDALMLALFRKEETPYYYNIL